jgi:uncharacterized protein
MTLFEQINLDLMSAMKAREKGKLEALRNLKKMMLEERATKGAGSELNDDESLKIIQKLVKQGKDSAEIYVQQNRPELAEVELEQVAALGVYLPQQMTPGELTAAVAGIIASSGAQSMKDMGRVMGLASKELAGKADGKDIAAKVKELLGQ